ncbi:regulator of chromosome condensation 1/beta-lactamase-inhibitor protein II [Radiomyces spectabilis]|uniref:regulator of chromosome condensation 1/beta-lactamase-inhibitor protein II n=1 Tax=Radiomyces spectabilis TaxID=64574 RepID=UPI00221FC47B|nr:regulator of chromosome condensation 1/beta-lactamase-inhibitor protein II [Radiomyces spectabilis]KAI8370326.1 regulator of chromosome condensation 1/beta-lactamase-inhibitor protein II [Radiomyces spectabilis]
MSKRNLKRDSPEIEETTESVDTAVKRTRTENGHLQRTPLLRRKASSFINDLPDTQSTIGKVFVFGSGDTGQLGLGDEMLTRKRPMPLKVLDDKEIVDVACGGMHSIALTKSGQLWSWGCNDQRALGRSGEEYEPGLVENLDEVHVVKVVCGDSVSVALSSEGHVYSWGTYRNAEGVLGFSPDVGVQSVPALFEPLQKYTIVDIAAGTDHCLALTNTGRVLVWGNGQQGQLGRRVIERRKRNALVPVSMALRNIKAIGSGSYHSFALSHDNDLYVWGLNNFQQCGLLTKETPTAPNTVNVPTIIRGLKGKGPIKSVTAGEHHSLVLLENGDIYGFGRADSSQIGLPQSMIDELHTHEEGQDTSQFKRAIGYPTKIPAISKVRQVSSGSNHAIAVTTQGKAYTWGFGEMYALGNGSDEDEAVPTELTGQKLEGHQVLRAAAGAQHTIILATL